jgi:hypothetical protein
MGQSEVLLETCWGTHCELDENKVKTWWEQQKSTKPYYPDMAYPPPPSWKKTRSKRRGALEKMGEEPGPRREGCARQAACPLKPKLKPRSSVLCILFPYIHNRFAQNIIFKKQTKQLEKHERIKISIKSPCLHHVFGPPFTPKPLFQPQVSGYTTK